MRRITLLGLRWSPILPHLMICLNVSKSIFTFRVIFSSRQCRSLAIKRKGRRPFWLVVFVWCGTVQWRITLIYKKLQTCFFFPPLWNILYVRAGADESEKPSVSHPPVALLTTLSNLLRLWTADKIATSTQHFSKKRKTWKRAKLFSLYGHKTSSALSGTSLPTPDVRQKMTVTHTKISF